MSITTYSEYKTKVETAQPLPFTIGNLGVGITFIGSAWTIAPLSGAAPTTAAALNMSTTGAMFASNLQNSYTNDRFIGKTELNQLSGNTGFVMLIDRLSHQGGLSGTVTTPQTTNLPTAALTRYTSGVGVFAALEIYGAIGATPATATISYTNQAGTSGRTSKPVLFGGSGPNAIKAMATIPLQDGDTGVRSVESVTLSGSTGTAGNFGITLYKPLLMIPVLGNFTERQTIHDAVLGGAMVMPLIEDNCCLNFIGRTNNVVANVITGDISFVEG